MDVSKQNNMDTGDLEETQGAMIALLNPGCVDALVISDKGTSLWKKSAPLPLIKKFSTMRSNSNADKIEATETGFRFTYKVKRMGDLLNGTDIKLFTPLNDFALRIVFPGKPKGMKDSLFYKVLEILLRHELFHGRHNAGVYPDIRFRNAEIKIGRDEIQCINAENMMLRSGKPNEENYISRCPLTGELRNETCIQLPFFFSESRANALPLIALKHHETVIYVEISVGEKERSRFIQNNTLLESKFVYLTQEERTFFCDTRHEYNIYTSYYNTWGLPHCINEEGVTKRSTTLSTRVVFGSPTEYLAFVLYDKRGPIVDLQSVCLKFYGKPFAFGCGNDFLVKFPQRYGFPPFRDENGVLKPRHFVISFSESPMDPGDLASTGTVNLHRIDIVTIEITFPPNFKPLGKVKMDVFGRHVNQLIVSHGMAARHYGG